MAAPLDMRRKRTSVIEFLFLKRLNAANIYMGLVNVSVKADVRRLVGRVNGYPREKEENNANDGLVSAMNDDKARQAVAAITADRRIIAAKLRERLLVFLSCFSTSFLRLIVVLLCHVRSANERSWFSPNSYLLPPLAVFSTFTEAPIHISSSGKWLSPSSTISFRPQYTL